ncbi:MAG: helix-turn-helix domain-containing protein [Chthoniobacteraceae bacterium]
MPPSRSPAEDARAEFLRSISAATPFYQLFDHLPEIAFFAKDRDFRLMCASKRFLDGFGFRSEADVIGKSDFELFPERLAESFRRDDEEVFRTGQPKLNIVELFFNEQGVPDWFVTNKLPLRNDEGELIGLMASIHSYEGRREVLHPYLQLDRAITYIRQHFRSGVSVKELAHAVHLSPRQLHRKFMDSFGMSPQTFIMKLRIQAACEALQREDAEISDTARALGFCSQSAFTQLFQKYVGLTPLKFQKQFQLRRRGKPTEHAGS